jgi:hypothetical protein
MRAILHRDHRFGCANRFSVCPFSRWRVRWFGFNGIRENIHCHPMSLDASFQLDEVAFLEVAAASLHIWLQGHKVIPGTSRVRE